MAEWSKKVITSAGRNFIAKQQTGINFKFTRVIVGDGIHYKNGELVDVDKILNPLQYAEIKEINVVGNETVSIKSILSNKELYKGYFIREIGILAISEDEPDKEVVYCIAITYEGKADYWPEFDGTECRLPINMSVAIGDAVEVKAEIINTYEAYEIGYDNSKSILEAINVQQALDEITLLNPIECIIEHNLDSYPQVMVLEVEYGCGYYGCGEVPCGGGSSKEMRSLTVYDDRNSLQLRILKNLYGEPEMERVSRNEFILKYPDTSLSVILFEGYTITPGIGETKLSGTLDLMSELAVRQLVSDEVTRLTAAINVSKGGADKAVTELRTGLTGLSTTVTNNKAESGNSISKLNTALLSLNTTVSNNKTAADSSINGLSASLSELGTTVTSNKETVDKALNGLETSLGENIAAVPFGCGN